MDYTLFLNYIVAGFGGGIITFLELATRFSEDLTLVLKSFWCWFLVVVNSFIAILVYTLINHYDLPLIQENNLVTPLLVGLFFPIIIRIPFSFRLINNPSNEISLTLEKEIYEPWRKLCYRNIQLILIEQGRVIDFELSERLGFDYLKVEVQKRIELLSLNNSNNTYIDPNQLLERYQAIVEKDSSEQDKSEGLAHLLYFLSTKRSIKRILNTVDNRKKILEPKFAKYNPKSYRQLLASINNYDGNDLELKFIVCNSETYQLEIITRLKGFLGSQLKLITLNESDSDLYQVICQVTENNKMDELVDQNLLLVLAVNGFKNVTEVNLNNLLKSAKQKSDKFKNFHYFIILCFSEDLNNQFIRKAQDFYSIGTSIEFSLSSEIQKPIYT